MSYFILAIFPVFMLSFFGWLAFEFADSNNESE